MLGKARQAAFVRQCEGGCFGREAMQRMVLSYVCCHERVVLRLAFGSCCASASPAMQRAFGLSAVQQLLGSFLAEQKTPLLVLGGAAGAGKSTLMASCVRATRNELSHMRTFFHFVGVSPGSTDLTRLLRRMFIEIGPQDMEVPSTLDDLIRIIPQMLERAGRWVPFVFGFTNHSA